MYLHVVVEGPFMWRPSVHRSSITTRVAWGWFAVAKVHVSEHTYATTEYDWVIPHDWKVPPRFEGERFRRVKARRRFFTRV